MQDPVSQSASLAPLDSEDKVIIVLFKVLEFYDVRVGYSVKQLRFVSKSLQRIVFAVFAHNLQTDD